MTERIDTTGRRIRPGDEVRDSDWGTSRMVLPKSYWQSKHRNVAVSAPHHSWEHRKASDLTIVSRSGEPIEDISPMCRDAAGKVIERGVRVRVRVRVLVRDILTVGTVLLIALRESGCLMATVRTDSGQVFTHLSDGVTVLPTEPETVESVVRHPRGFDLRAALAGMKDAEVVS